MPKRLLPALFLPLVALSVLAACGDDGGGSENGDSASNTEPAQSADEATTSTEAATNSGDADASEGALEVPDGAVMAARLTTEEDGETSVITSESEGSCGFSVLTPDTYDLSFSIIEGMDNSGLESIEGPDVDGFGLEVLEGESTGEVGFSRTDVNEFDYEHSDEEADITVTEEGDGVRFTFEGENTEGVPFSGEAVCTSVVDGGA